MRFFPGASVEKMHDYLLKPLLKKVPGTIVLHIKTNNCVNESPNNVLNKILSLKECIKKGLPECKSIILNIVERLDNGKAALSVKRLNENLLITVTSAKKVQVKRNYI